MKLITKISINLILIIVMTVLFTGCGSKSDVSNSKAFKIYYVDESGTKVVNEDYTLKSKDTKHKVQELLNKLQKGGKSADAIRAIPDSVKVNKFGIADGIVTVDFSLEYTEISNVREVLGRAAVVLTLSQIKGVDYVAFTINDQPYTMDNGTIVGSMQASDFVSDLKGNSNTVAKGDFKLYFANKNGSKLKLYELNKANYGGKSKEQFIIEKLIAGPTKKGYTATLSPKIKLISVVISNSICYVNFDDSFTKEQSSVNNKLVIYSIVNSLSELNEIHKVQISVNGNSGIKYQNDILLSEPFMRNLDLVQK